ncbi:hypothetical protein POPTR_005G192050v4 [Populus trichocarpa]|uniref:Uncharacterized protein n=1 Tax=Populus trichocarpa TaxID=3694 RepID=A0ACC0T1L9_POPTR|nr:hypothetical protein POPTR_005G192050v4 [Populus trichocarpa]
MDKKCERDTATTIRPTMFYFQRDHKNCLSGCAQYQLINSDSWALSAMKHWKTKQKQKAAMKRNS